MKRKFFFIIIFFTCLILTAEENTVISFPDFLLKSDAVEIWTVKPGNRRFILDYSDTRRNDGFIPELSVTAYKVEAEDNWFPGSKVLRIRGLLSVRQPEAVVETVSDLQGQGEGFVSDIGPVVSLSVKIRNSGTPVEISFIFEDDAGNYIYFPMGTVYPSRKWNEYIYYNPEYMMISRFPGIRIKYLRLKGFTIIPEDLKMKIDEKTKFYYDNTEEKKIEIEELYKTDPDKVLPYSEAGIDIQFGEIIIRHGYEKW